MPRRALVVGIDHYDNIGSLTGCVADATAVAQLLVKHEDKRPNYDCRLHTSSEDGRSPITRAALRRLLVDLFTDADGEVLLYFAGHGAVTATGAYLCTTDAEGGDLGVSVDEVLQLASRSPAGGVLIVLDCCHAGSLGNPGVFAGELADSPLALLRQDVTIIAAARPSQLAEESGGHGRFTAALLDALRGGAKDVLGVVTAPALYGYVERRFDAWGQRPVYKSHATRVPVVRECAPAIDVAKLRQLPDLFPTADFKYKLDPRHERDDEWGEPAPEAEKALVDVGDLVRAYRDAGLLRASEPGETVYDASRRGHTVELTRQGQDYWWLAKNGRL